MTTSENTMFRWIRDDEGIVTVMMDDPGQTANTMNDRFRADFAELVERLHGEVDSITGVIITSAKDTFCAGGDLDGLMRATRADAPAFDAIVAAVHTATRRLEALPRPVVAAINGAALGGGYELALACHHRVLTDRASVRVGLPEVNWGLLPAAGGTVRTVRLLGIVRALQEVLLTGKAFAPNAALAAGLVDEVVPADDLMLAARRWIAANPDAAQPWDAAGYRLPGGLPTDPKVAQMLPALPAMLRQQSRGPLLPATRNILAAAVEGAGVDVDRALGLERQYFVDLVGSPIPTNLIQSRFFDMNAIKKGLSRPEGHPPRPARKVVVLGAGMMGAGIAYVSAQAGLDVVLKDVNSEAAEKGKAYSARLLDKAVKSGRSTPDQRDAVLGRILATADVADAAGADFVVEAVFEDPELKKRVIAEVLPHLAPDAVISTNTSTLPITGLAEGVPCPENFIGTHFFSPVDKMPLLEIVVGEKTNDATLARTLDFAAQIRKTPIVVNDSRGFFTSRVISTYMDEAIAMVGEGVPAASVEQATLQAGYPVGALALLDEVSLTLNRRIRHETAAAMRDAGQEVVLHSAAGVIDRMLDEFGRGGRATGGGFYAYDAASGAKLGLWPGLATAFDSTPDRIPFEDMKERMLFAEALESVRCLDEGVLRTVIDANVGSLLGIGYPAWTGGVLQYINSYQGGLAGFVRRSAELAERYGERFRAPESLVARAEAGEDYR